MQQLRTVRQGRTMIGLIAAATILAACSAGTNGRPVAAPGPTAVADIAEVSIIAAGGNKINPTTPIVVKAANGTLSVVTVTNPKGAKVTGGFSADKTTWTTDEVLGYGTAYQVVADATGTDGHTTEQNATVQTLAPAAQAYPSVIPAPDQTDVGIGQPLVVKFDHDVTDQAAAEKALAVTSSPPQTGGWYWLNKREVHYRPKDYWQAASTVKLDIKVYGVALGGGVYGQADRSVTYRIHDSWVAKADGRTEQMQIVHNGQVVDTMPISLGSPRYTSHSGPHVISFKAREYTMDSCTFGLCPGQPGAYRAKELFTERISSDGEFVHENPNTVGQQGNVNVSHGCVNLSPANAMKFFAEFGPGDVVEVTNSGGAPLPLSDTYGDWELSWAQWQAGSALNR